MRNNIGKGYVIETLNTAEETVTVSPELVEVYLPKEIKKESHLDREPVKGDIVLRNDGKEILLVALWHEDNSAKAEADLEHADKIAIKAEKAADFKLIKDKETTFDELLNNYEHESRGTEHTLEKREERKLEH